MRPLGRTVWVGINQRYSEPEVAKSKALVLGSTGILGVILQNRLALGAPECAPHTPQKISTSGGHVVGDSFDYRDDDDFVSSPRAGPAM
jgi:hypothetical protein